MKPLVVALAVATLGAVIYHLGQKLVPPTAHPMAVLMAAYAVAFTVSAVALPCFQPAGQVAPWRAAFTGMATGPGVRVALVLGLGVLLIEVGFLLAYRAGGSLQSANVIVNGGAALVLVPIAIGVFKEAFSPLKAMGVLLVLAGLLVLTRR